MTFCVFYDKVYKAERILGVARSYSVRQFTKFLTVTGILASLLYNRRGSDTREITMLEVGQVSIRCRDLEKSLKFYRGILGLKEVNRVEYRGIRIVALKAGSVEVELTQGKSADEPAQLAGRSGLNHFAFYVENVDEMVKQLKQRGVKFTVEPKQITEDIRAAFFEGPDGERLELCALGPGYPGLRKP